MTKTLLNIAGTIPLRGGEFSRNSSRNAVNKKYNLSLNYSDDCNCYNGDCSDCVCTDCNECGND